MIKVSYGEGWLFVENNLQKRTYVDGRSGKGLINLMERYKILPFTTDAVNAAVNKYLSFSARTEDKMTPYRVLEELFNVRKAVDPGAVLVYHKDRILPIALATIAFFYLKNGVVNLTTFDKKTYLINKTLEELGAIAEPLFFRANRQFLINRKAVVDASSYLARKLSVTLSVPTEGGITISKEKMTAFLEWLTQMPS